MTVTDPTATPVKLAAQLPDNNVQLALTVPTAVLDDTKLTEPVGVFAGVVVSETLAVQVEVAPGTIVLGLQTTLVEVLSNTWFAKLAVWMFSVSKPPPPFEMKTQSGG